MSLKPDKKSDLNKDVKQHHMDNVVFIPYIFHGIWRFFLGKSNSPKD